MNYLRNNAITAAVFLLVGGMTLFVPLPEGFGLLPIVFILILMLGAFYIASLFSLPEKLASSILGAALSLLSSIALSVCVVTVTMLLAEFFHRH